MSGQFIHKVNLGQAKLKYTPMSTHTQEAEMNLQFTLKAAVAMFELETAWL